MSQRVNVSDESYKMISSFAKLRDMEIGEATEHLAKVGRSRISALANYAKTGSASKKRAKPKAKKPKAAKPKAPRKPKLKLVESKAEASEAASE